MAESELIVFVVDDDEAARESLQALLESAATAPKPSPAARHFWKPPARAPAGA